MSFATIPEALEDFRAGRMLVVVDDEDRENEGDLTMAARVDHARSDQLHGHARPRADLPGALRRTLRRTASAADVAQNTSRFGTAFCESIDAVEGVTTGISAADRSHTIRVAMRAQEYGSRPGPSRPYFSPARREGGVLVRAGQTEAAVDLARMAGFEPGGVICEIMNADGSMARVPQLTEFCEQHGLKMISVAELIRYRLETEHSSSAAPKAASKPNSARSKPFPT